MGRKKIHFSDSSCDENSKTKKSKQYYAIDQILDEKVIDGEEMYLVSWKGYPSIFNSWVFKKTVKPIDEKREEDTKCRKNKEKDEGKKTEHIQRKNRLKLGNGKKRQTYSPLPKGRKKIQKKGKKTNKSSNKQVIVIESSTEAEKPKSTSPSHSFNLDNLQISYQAEIPLDIPQQMNKNPKFTQFLNKNGQIKNNNQTRQEATNDQQNNEQDEFNFNKKTIKCKPNFIFPKVNQMESKCQKIDKKGRQEQKKKQNINFSSMQNFNLCSLAASLENPIRLESGFLLGQSFLHLRKNTKNHFDIDGRCQLPQKIKKKNQFESSLEQLANFFDESDQDEADTPSPPQETADFNECTTGKNEDLNDSFINMESDETPFTNILRNLQKSKKYFQQNDNSD